MSASPARDPAGTRCPAAHAPAGPLCPEGRACPADLAALLPRGGAELPRDGAERAVLLALRYVAAAAETGDAACFDAAFDGAEAAFGPRDGALLVARAAALVRALAREGVEFRFLPPPCRRLSPGEAALLAALRACLSGRGEAAGAGLCGPARAALGDLAAPARAAARGLPFIPGPLGAGDRHPV